MERYDYPCMLSRAYQSADASLSLFCVSSSVFFVQYDQIQSETHQVRDGPFLSPSHKHTHSIQAHTRRHLLCVCRDSSALECAAICSIGIERRREVSSTADEYSWTLPPLATQIPTHRHTVLLRLPDTSLSSHDVYTAFYPWAFLTLDQSQGSMQALASTSHPLSVKEVVCYPKNPSLELSAYSYSDMSMWKNKMKRSGTLQRIPFVQKREKWSQVRKIEKRYGGRQTGKSIAKK